LEHHPHGPLTQLVGILLRCWHDSHLRKVRSLQRTRGGSLWALRTCFPCIRLVWADGGYAGQLLTWAATTLKLTVQIVRKLAGHAGFTVLARRWVAERTLSWINRCRRTVRDYERLPDHHAAMVQWSMVIIMTRRLARYRTTSRSPTTQTT